MTNRHASTLFWGAINTSLNPLAFEFGASAYDPARNLLVVNMSNLAHIIRLTDGDAANGVDELDHDAEFTPMQGTPFGMTRATFLSSLGLPCPKPPWGVLAAVDLDSGQIVWRKTLGTTQDIAPMDDYLRAFDVVIAAGGHSSLGTKFGDHVIAFALEE